MLLRLVKSDPRRALPALFALAPLCLVLGCNVDTSGTAADDPFDGGATDASIGVDTSIDTAIEPLDGKTTPVDTATSSDTVEVFDVTVPPPPLDTAPPPPDVPTCDLTACAPTSSPRVALVDASIACPAGFRSTDVVEATTGDGCRCSCTLSPGLCSSTPSLATKYSDDGSCSTTGTTLHPVLCTALGGDVDFGGDRFGASVPPPVGASCTPLKTADKAAQSRKLHLCEPDASTCFGPACAAPFAQCIEVVGPCPSSHPTPRKVGSDLILTCPAACGCTTNPGNCTGTVDFFSSGTCGGDKTSFAVDGGCYTVPGSTGTIRSYTFTAKPPSGGSCAPSSAGAPGTATLVAQRSFCCR